MVQPKAKLTPLYHQMFASLRDQIADGVYRKDDLLPGEMELAERFGVSRITARRALSELAAHGLVVRHQGLGTFVTGTALTRPMRTTVYEFLRHSRSMLEATKFKMLSHGWASAPANIAEKLEIQPGTPVLLHRLVRLRNGPTMYALNYFAPGVAQRIEPREVGREPNIVLFERLGIEVARAAQSFSAVAADGDSGPVLHVAAGTPLLVTERILFDRAGTPLELTRSLLRPDRHELTLEFSVGAARAKPRARPLR